MTKFVAVVIFVAFTIVFSSSAMAEGWKIGNWEPPTKAARLKAVSLNDWGTSAVEPVATVAAAGCSGVVQHSHAAPAMRAGCSSGRGGGWFFGRRIMANRQARAQARFSARAQYSMATGHS